MARTMSAKSFLFKSGTKIATRSASGFLAGYREWLKSGELAHIVEPILIAMDRDKEAAISSGKDTESIAKAALEEIQVATLEHIQVEAERKNIERMQKAGEATKNPSYTEAVAYDEDGSEVISKAFYAGERARGWLDRRLFEGGVRGFGKLFYPGGFIEEVKRDESIERILKSPRGAVMKAGAKTTNRLGFGVKVVGDRSVFSGG
jgi:hypothetical protein